MLKPSKSYHADIAAEELDNSSSGVSSDQDGGQGDSFVTIVSTEANDRRLTQNGLANARGATSDGHGTEAGRMQQHRRAKSQQLDPRDVDNCGEDASSLLSSSMSSNSSEGCWTMPGTAGAGHHHLTAEAALMMLSEQQQQQRSSRNVSPAGRGQQAVQGQQQWARAQPDGAAAATGSTAFSHLTYPGMHQRQPASAAEMAERQQQARGAANAADLRAQHIMQQQLQHQHQVRELQRMEQLKRLAVASGMNQVNQHGAAGHQTMHMGARRQLQQNEHPHHGHHAHTRKSPFFPIEETQYCINIQQYDGTRRTCLLAYICN